MARITFIGAGSTVFAKNLLGDILGFPELANSEIVLTRSPWLKETSAVPRSSSNRLYASSLSNPAASIWLATESREATFIATRARVTLVLGATLTLTGANGAMLRTRCMMDRQFN